ncbi:hypothetical protein NW752_007960 [Fusarium irregulare]|uniref:CHAT domain-containing protein n=1 Tax=Fusarium irregulare TaxID=2494466 RepID=A0A9W8PXM6_9HYPO|nr:hypothetical protein NW752_007960 [Fusarium irregulare]KAJ4019765.1 hypothetical protein NW766_003524 [Fusarium irregulare]
MSNIEKLDQEILEATETMPPEPEKDIDGKESLEKLGDLLIAQYQQTGNTDDLRAALRHRMRLFRSIHLPEEDSLVYYVIIDGTLHGDVSCRYRETEDLEDLRSAIAICWQVFFEEPDNAKHEAMPIRLPFLLRDNTLHLYEKSGDWRDIERVISYSKRALPFVPMDVKDRANPVHEFAGHLFKKYQVEEDPEILRVGVPLSRDSISATPEGNPEIPARIANLGAWLLRSYEQNGDMNNLLAAIEKTELAISLLDKNDFNQLRFLTNLAIMLFRKLEMSRADNDPDQVGVIASCADIGAALQIDSLAHPLLGIEGARRAIRIFKLLGRLDEANSLAQKALQLLPMASHPSTPQQDQQHAIEQMSRLAAETCSLSLLVGKEEEALLGIEFSREIILHHLFKYKKKMSLLEQRNRSSWAKTFDDLRSKAAQPISAVDQVTLKDRIVPEIQDFDHDHAFYLGLIRSLPDFEDFLKLPKLDNLLEGGTDGSIVIVNITPLSSDAIIISTYGKRVRSLNLPKANPSGESFLDRHLKAFSRIKKPQSSDKQEIEGDEDPHDLYDRQFLGWLWTACVEPILKEITGLQSSSPTSRIWWIGTGIASGFPFHAAGNSEGGTLDHAISSYIPSITSLKEARTRTNTSDNDGDKTSVLIVRIPGDPDGGQSPDLTEAFQGMDKTHEETFTAVTLSEPSIEEILKRMDKFDVVHFACDGHSDSFNPSQSYVQVGKRLSSDADEGELTAELISDDGTLDKPQVAFLSLHPPAGDKTERLTDEGLGIISAFQLAGFRHALGSLSKADGASQAFVAKSFYQALRQNRSDYQVAKALHDATRSARDHKSDPHWWAPYIHSGP